MERVSVYVDGFNLYYGLRARGWRRYYWLDLRSMAAASFTIGRGILSRSQLPERVVKPDGYVLRRPESWG